MRILLAAGVFFPDVGGPAIHVRKIAERLAGEGLEPIVLAYGDDPSNTNFHFNVKRVSRKYPKVLQWLFYTLYSFWYALRSKLIYSFDPTAAGLAPFIAAKLFYKPFIIRIGGDPIWEREAEMGRRVMPLSDYYKKGLYMQDKPMLFKIIKFVLAGASKVIFYNELMKKFYNQYYNVPLEKILIVKNPVFKRESADEALPERPTIIFAGRFVSYKNLPLVLNAFENVRQKNSRGELLLIGKGPDKEELVKLRNSLKSKDHITFFESLPQEELFKKIRESAFAIGPALSEFNPNFILESLSFGKPVLLSRGHGLSVLLDEEFLFDPLDQSELERKTEYLFDPNNYREAVRKVAALPMDQTWEKVTDFHLSLVKEFTK
jgi:glycosyltransferase involved in cell wall biosynthesis